MRNSENETSLKKLELKILKTNSNQDEFDKIEKLRGSDTVETKI